MERSNSRIAESKRSRVALRVVAGLLGLLCSVGSTGGTLAAGTFVVDGAHPSCSDTGPGTEATPYCTISMGDEDFVPVPKVGLLAAPYVASRGALIQEGSRMATPSAGDPRPFDMASGPRPMMLAAASVQEEGGHTTHFSVVDRWGNVVSYTTTIENVWGSGIMVPGYGFLLNNELTDFNFTPQFNPATGNPGANDVPP